MNAPRYGAPAGRVDAYPQNDRTSAPLRLAADLPQADRKITRRYRGSGQRKATRSMHSARVAVTPTATLACPIVSALDRWLADSVQPSAMRWFGTRVVEIKQISPIPASGMNGSSRAHISEHAFGNALDIAAFTLADGRRITVKDGWKGMPEEQGFLHEVQGAACQQFNTVLAPGSNVYHHDHIHVDLMRRSSRRSICQPGRGVGRGDRFARDAAQSLCEPRTVGDGIAGRTAQAVAQAPGSTKEDEFMERLGAVYNVVDA